MHQKHHGKSVLKVAQFFHRILTLSTVRPVVTKELAQTECQKELAQTMNVKRTCTNYESQKNLYKL